MDTAECDQVHALGGMSLRVQGQTRREKGVPVKSSHFQSHSVISSHSIDASHFVIAEAVMCERNYREVREENGHAVTQGQYGIAERVIEHKFYFVMGSS